MIDERLRYPRQRSRHANHRMVHSANGLRRAARPAVELDQPVYDSRGLALAQRIETQLVTADTHFANAPAPTGYGGTVETLTDYMRDARLI